ncbi:MAG: toll/interleukin-1 receptor domain-containing protein, partial [Leptospiraceae bacterium]|nr:toll/interleukin-1 receptor domain-containing protein [Leptospiraceae bacterium]
MVGVKLGGLPVTYPIDIRINRNHSEIDSAYAILIKGLEKLVKRMGGTWEILTDENSDITPLPNRRFLDVLVCDAINPTVPDTVTQDILDEKYKSAWVLPMMAKDLIKTGPATLQSSLGKQNVAFWENHISEMTITILARAGVTTLDRRIFISYRRTETQPMADQLFDALTRLNFSVFLDTVSINPGEDFQARLFEQLTDKSMILLLHSPDFSNSKWCMEEVIFARKFELGLQVLRLPGASPKDKIYQYISASNVVEMKESNLVDYEPGKQFKLQDQELERLVRFITLTHDASMVRRLQLIRNKIENALESSELTPIYSDSGAFISSDINGQMYSFFPSPRPPGLNELFEAGTRAGDDIGHKRVVVGQTGNMERSRRKQLDWVVKGHSTTYVNIFNLKDLVSYIKENKND